jgi:hypothetical protein
MKRLVWWGYVIFMTAMLMVPHELLPAWMRGGGSSLDWLGPKDKLLHAGSFACLMLVSAWASGNWGRWPTAEGFWCFVYGVATEIAQGVTGWRDAEWMDLAADSVGILIGGILARGMSRWNRSNRDE